MFIYRQVQFSPVILLKCYCYFVILLKLRLFRGEDDNDRKIQYVILKYYII